MKLKQIATAMQGLTELGKSNLGAKRNFQVAIRIREIEQYVIEYEVQRGTLLSKYGTDEGGGKFSLLPQAMADYQAELAPLDNQDIKIDVADKIKIKEEDFTTAETLLKCFDFVELEAD